MTPDKYRTPSTGLDDAIAHCQLHCRTCELLCQSTLSQDVTYIAPGTQPYARHQLALVTCAAVCRLAIAALGERHDIRYMCAWCMDVCQQTAAAVRAVRGPPEVGSACSDCAAACYRVLSELDAMSSRG